MYFSSEEAADPTLPNVTLVHMLGFAFAAPAVVDVTLGVHHTSLVTSSAQQAHLCLSQRAAKL